MTATLLNASPNRIGSRTSAVARGGMPPVLGHVTQWVTAAPLWKTAGADPVQMARPALLRFESDSFMEDLIAQLQSPQPEKLADRRARPEGFRARPVGADPDWTPPAPAQLKLYQPVHGHFYLVAASLVCRAVGLPDRAVDVAAGEKISFVLRRKIGGSEWAWVVDPVTGNGWQPIVAGREQSVANSEELLPMFPVSYLQAGRKRRLFVGLTPTASRETYAAAPALSLLAPPDDADLQEEAQRTDPRFGEVETRVLESLEALLAFGAKPTRQVAQEVDASVFLLLDLADWLNAYFPALWKTLDEGGQVSSQAPGHALFLLLNGRSLQGGDTWLAALRTVWAQRKVVTGDVEGEPPAYNVVGSTMTEPELRAALSTLVAMTPASPAQQPAAPELATLEPKLDARPDVRYILRCVYQRPHCAPLQPDVVSAPTDDFSIASFFDFDAPARPIRITMPIDTSIAGLRKFRKNVAFQISDQLRSQMNSVVDMKKALDGDLASGQEFNLGVICSFSIPIITICAMIVLLLFVFLLNIVFWWVPFLRICLPIRLKAR